jgi:thioredoxin 1
MLKIALFILAGAAVGGIAGYVGKCTSGACPFTANPFRGAAFGALIGVALGMAGGGVTRRQSAPDSPSIVNIENAAALDTLLAGSTVPVLVDFYADWCGPCRQLAPELNALADAWQSRALIVKVNVDRHRDLAAQYRVKGIPDMRLFSGGKQVEQIIGYRSRDQLANALQRVQN